MDWLLKSEPSGYSFEDLEKEKSTVWDDRPSVVLLSPAHLAFLAGD